MAHEAPDDRQVSTDPDTARQDTDAILSRRRFLIRSGLAGAGIAMSGCDQGGKTDKAAPSKPPNPGPCLKVRAPQPDAAVSRPCLSVPEMKPDAPPGRAPV